MQLKLNLNKILVNIKTIQIQKINKMKIKNENA